MMVGDLGMRVRERIQRYGKEIIFSASGGGGKGVRKFVLSWGYPRVYPRVSTGSSPAVG